MLYHVLLWFDVEKGYITTRKQEFDELLGCGLM